MAVGVCVSGCLFGWIGGRGARSGLAPFALRLAFLGALGNLCFALALTDQVHEPVEQIVAVARAG